MVDGSGGFQAQPLGSRKSLSARLKTFYAKRSQQRRQRRVVLALLLSDVLLALLVWGVADTFYYVWGANIPPSSAAVQRLEEVWGSGTISQIAAISVLPIIAVWITTRWLLGLYPGYAVTAAEKLRRQTYALGATVATVATFALAFHVGILLPRLPLALGFLALLFLAPLLRASVEAMLMRFGMWGAPAVILSAGEAGAQMARLLRKERCIGLSPVAVFGNQGVPPGEDLDGVPYGGDLDEAKHVVEESGMDTAIVIMPRTQHMQLIEAVNWASTVFRYLIIVPNMMDGAMIANSAVTGRDLGGTLGLEVKHNLLNPWARRTKRALDLVLVLSGGILILPLLLGLAVLVRLESQGTVFYTDRRLGRNAKPFHCLKFRTMVPDAEAVLDRVLADNAEMREEYSKYHKLRNDPRVTRAGRFLRKTSLDELPQIWNVLRGEMSLVGPRPYLPRESPDIGEAQKEILRVRPGMTGPWQVGGRNNTSFAERTQIDTHYVRNWSVWLDLVILARTVKIVALRAGAH